MKVRTAKRGYVCNCCHKEIEPGSCYLDGNVRGVGHTRVHEKCGREWSELIQLHDEEIDDWEPIQ